MAEMVVMVDLVTGVQHTMVEKALVVQEVEEAVLKYLGIHALIILLQARLV